MGSAQVSPAAAALLAAVALAGCATGSADPGADGFVRVHAAAAQRAAAAASALQAGVASLSRPPSASQLQALEVQARRARREIVPATEWDVNESGEEEDLSQAELELNEGAGSLMSASAALRAYARDPSASRLALYESELAHGRERWNQGVRQLWYLAHRAGPPTV